MLKISIIVAISTLAIARSAIALSFLSTSEFELANSCQQIFIEPKIARQTNSNKKTSTFNLPPQISIWWAAEQFDPFGGKLIQDWLAHPRKQQIELTVNWQLWSVLDYFGRYRFVHQIGTGLRKYGYSLNILNQKKQCLASYKYNPISNPPKWELHLEKLGKDSLEIDSPESL